MGIKAVNYLSIVSLLASAGSLVLLLTEMLSPWMSTVCLAYGVCLMILSALMLVPRKCHFAFLETCQEGPKLVVFRMVFGIILFLLSWYLHAGSVSVFGAENPRLSHHGIVMLIPLFTMFAHVVFAACVKKSKTWSENTGKRL